MPSIVDEVHVSSRAPHVQGSSDALAGNSVGELLPQIRLEGALRMVARNPACFDVRPRACSPAWQPSWGTCYDGQGAAAGRS